MEKKDIAVFFAFVILASIPFWGLGLFKKQFTENSPIKLPLTALMAICPFLVASILIHKKSKNGITLLLKKTYDFKKINRKIWLIPILLLMPAIAAISHFYSPQKQQPLINDSYTIIQLVVFFTIFFIGAAGEELGWSGYVKSPMIKEFGTTKTGLYVGIIWAAWHIIPYYEMGRSSDWILLQCINTILLRIVMVWLFANTNQSVFAMILFHTMINISPYLFSKNQVTYDPTVLLSILLIIVLSIFVVTVFKLA